jgi:hypothetical protein
MRSTGRSFSTTAVMIKMQGLNFMYKANSPAHSFLDFFVTFSTGTSDADMVARLGPLHKSSF